jgi:hypothetical protein
MMLKIGKITAVTECTDFISIRVVGLPSTKSAGTSTISMPTVVPMTTSRGCS